MCTFNYKETNFNNSQLGHLSSLNRSCETSNVETFKEKSLKDVKLIIPFLTNFNVQNISSNEFIDAILQIERITKYFFFDNFDIFQEYNLFNTLFFFAFPDPGSECDFIQSRSLKILKNFVDSPIQSYSSMIIDMGVIKHVSSILNSNSDAVINSAIKLLISLAPINLSITQDILSVIKIKSLIMIDKKFPSHKSIKLNINRLVYFLSRCDTREEIKDFIEFICILIDEIQLNSVSDGINVIITIFMISHNLIKDNETADLFHNMPSFIQLLNSSLSFNSEDEQTNFYVWIPAIKTIDFLHFYNNKLIKDLDYNILISFLDTDDEDLSLLVTETFINILSSAQLATFFVSEYNIINKLLIIRSLGLIYPINKNVIEAISNAILVSPKHLISTFVEAGCFVELLDSLHIDDNSLLCKILKCIDIILSVRVLDEKKKDIVECEFKNNFDSCDFVELQSNEDCNVQFYVKKLINNHPNYFSNA